VRLGLALAVLIAVVGCGGHGASTTRAVKPEPRIHVRLTADSHRPSVGKPWHYEVRVTDAAGKPVPARIHLQIVFNGVPVGPIGRHRVANGVWRETVGEGANQPFPNQARGIPLTFQAVVTALGQTQKANYRIQVQ
jgi:hypothetical protein